MEDELDGKQESKIDEEVINKEKSNFNSLSAGIAWMNFWLFLIFICSLGSEKVANSISDSFIVKLEKEYIH